MTDAYDAPPGVGHSPGREMACPRCGYELSHMDVNQCPKCGVYFDGTVMSVRRRRRFLDACWPPARAGRTVALAGLLLLPFLWIAVSVKTGSPTWWKPFPLVFCIATFLLQSDLISFVLGSVVILCSFVICSWPLIKGCPRIPSWSLVAFTFLHGVNGLYLLMNYSDGVRTQGAAHTNRVCIITVALFVSLVLLAARCAWRPNFLVAVTFHWLAWFWLILYSFPLLGPFMTLV